MRNTTTISESADICTLIKFLSQTVTRVADWGSAPPFTLC